MKDLYRTIAEDERQRALGLFLEDLQPGWQNLKELQDEEVCLLDVSQLDDGRMERAHMARNHHG